MDIIGGDDNIIGSFRQSNARLRRQNTYVLFAVLALLLGLLLFGVLSFWPFLFVACPIALALWQLGRFGFDERRSTAVVAKTPEFPTRLQRVLEVLPDPTIIIDRRGLVAAFNGEAQAVFPLLRRDHPVSFAVRAPDLLSTLDLVLSGQGGRRRVELIEQVPVSRAFEVIISPIADQSAEARELVAVVLHDLTQARRIEAMRVDFVANASHELRTPLASLLGFIETLQGPARNDAPARDRFLGIMLQQAKRMSRLIDDLLSLSRIEMNAHVLPRERVDVVAVVGHIMDTLAGLAHDRDVELDVTRKDAAGILVAGDRDELLRVFENLVENAIKYGQSGGRVEVEFQLPPQQPGGRAEVVVSVRDYGPGIAAEHLPRLTERF